MKYYILNENTEDLKKHSSSTTINGTTKAFFIWLKEGLGARRNAILEHEKWHVRQFFMTFGFHQLIYEFCVHYRLWSELVGYTIQIKHELEEDGRYTKEQLINNYGGYLAKNYGLGMDEEKVIAKLRKKVG